MKKYIIFNHTDGIPAGGMEPHKTRESAQKWIDDYRASLKSHQGYYLTGNRERIPVEYEIQEITLTDDDFYERYTLLTNIINPLAPWNGHMYETYGEELEYIRKMKAMHPNKIWTILEVDNDLYIRAGYHHVNRMGYLVTATEWESEDEEYKCDSGEEQEGDIGENHENTNNL